MSNSRKAKNKLTLIARPQNPLVYIILPFFNAEKFLAQSLRSITEQTHQNWRLILVNDGSTDSSLKIAQQFLHTHSSQTKIISHHQNQGLAITLNSALEHIEKEISTYSLNNRHIFIARFDADDLMAPRRLQTQLNYFTNHSRVDLLGTALQLINLQGEKIHHKITVPLSNAWLQKALLFYCPLLHPTLMWRFTWQKKIAFRYVETEPLVEDYLTWIKFASRTVFTNLSQPLTFYRQHPQQISIKYQKQHAYQTKKATQLAQKQYLAQIPAHSWLYKATSQILSWSHLPKTIRILLLYLI